MDGTPGAPPGGGAGLGLIVRRPGGEVLCWACRRAAARTNNEAEYQAVIAGLELARQRFPAAALRCLTDSQIVVEQLVGRSAVRAPALQPLHTRALALARQFAAVQFVAIPRELNRLADALAWEALAGRTALAQRARSSRDPDQ